MTSEEAAHIVKHVDLVVRDDGVDVALFMAGMEMGLAMARRPEGDRLRDALAMLNPDVNETLSDAVEAISEAVGAVTAGLPN